MENGSKISWSSEAIHSLKQIYLYLELEWSDREIKKFSRKLHAILRNTLIFPYSHPISDVITNIRKAIVTKHTSIIYEIKEKEIQVLSLVDNRMEESNP